MIKQDDGALKAEREDKEQLTLEQYLKDRVSAFVHSLALDRDLQDCSPRKGGDPLTLPRKTWDDHWEDMVWNYDRDCTRSPSEYTNWAKELILETLKNI